MAHLNNIGQATWAVWAAIEIQLQLASTDPNQSRDFYPAAQLIWMADKVGGQYEMVVSVINMCPETMLPSTLKNKRLCFAMTVYVRLKSLGKI